MRSDLAARLDRLEDHLISPLARRIGQLSASDRRQYDDWVQRCREHFKQYEGEPGGYFAAILDGRSDFPQLPRHIDRQLEDDQPSLTTNVTVADAAEAWSRYRDCRK